MQKKSFLPIVLILSSNSVMAQGAIPAPITPPPPPSPPVNLNSRTFLNTASIFDPIYGLGKIGIVNQNTVEFVATKNSYTPPEADKVIPKGFKTYDYSYVKSDGGSVSIPIVGEFSITKDEALHIMMEDISEVYLKERRTPGSCEIWKNIDPTLVPAGSTIIYTDHAVFSTLQWGAGTKTIAGGEIGIGSYFSASGGTYRDAASMLKIPLISIDGVKFKVENPITFCTDTDRIESSVSRFNTIEDLGLSKGAVIQFKF